MKDNIRNVLNVIEYYDKNPNKEAGLFFVDAEKAFDNVNWDFIFLIMLKMNVGEKFIQAVKAIYSEQTARILFNDHLTEKI